MAQFSMRVQVIKRSTGRSSVAAAAYRSGEKLHDERQGITHNYLNRGGVDHKEILLPENAPSWVQGLDRETLWNVVEVNEKRKDSQTARELRLMIPRELAPDERITMVRDFVQRSFVDKGMIADLCFHNKIASDGLEQPHAHVMLTMRPLTNDGFGDKSRHDWVPDPDGRTHDDGRPVMVVCNKSSWNCPDYYEQCRENWENTANAALETAGFTQRIDRRSYLEQGVLRLPQPALRLAWYLKDLYGVMKTRFGHYQMARHYRAVEQAATAAFKKIDAAPATPAAQADAKTTTERFFGWFDRQIERLGSSPRPDASEHHSQHSQPPPPSNELER
jgi:ATP-dependent exoDNAse (exonuclease V) alpha subunit